MRVLLIDATVSGRLQIKARNPVEDFSKQSFLLKRILDLLVISPELNFDLSYYLLILRQIIYIVE